MKRPEPITADHVLAEFDCGRPVLDGWPVSRVLRNEQEGGSRTYVVSDDGKVIGYYCLAAGSVMRRAAPGKIRRNMPELIPVVLLGRLAVTRSHQGKGIARALVRDAVLRTLQAAEIAGIRTLLVHSLDEDAAAFYRNLGFVESPIDPLVLMLPLATARSALER
ncbi:MAG: GNAT family N-acetyltransferase [Chloroflexi bacterium]|nr:GNAT family N-acetyltransferase [Chloroflexota bacterium]